MSHHHDNKRRGQDDRTNKHHNNKRSRWNRQHLYLILDDWVKGFSVHKIDADSFVSCSDIGDHHHHQVPAAVHLPEPPALRLASSPGDDDGDKYADMTLAAMGTKIFAFMKNQLCCSLVYDTDTAVVGSARTTPDAQTTTVCTGYGGISVPVGGVLYLLSYRFTDDHGHHSFQAMSMSMSMSMSTTTDNMQAGGGGGGGWSWHTMPAPPPTFTTRQTVVAHAVHPDGHTIFMTTANKHMSGAPLGTYSFDTMEATWRWHGECALPFFGEGHFDAELGAWVGLGRDGHICACQAISADFDSKSRPPLKKHYARIDPNIYLDCKTTKEKLFCKDPKRYMRASLTCMGPGRFCLVECVESKEDRHLPLYGDYDGCVLHMTIFGLKYSDKGDLQVRHHRSTRSFKVSRQISHFGPFAFWM